MEQRRQLSKLKLQVLQLLLMPQEKGLNHASVVDSYYAHAQSPHVEVELSDASWSMSVQKNFSLAWRKLLEALVAVAAAAAAVAAAVVVVVVVEMVEA